MDATAISNTKLQKFVRKGASAGVAEGMRTCVDAAANDAAKAACKRTSGKAALASSLGKDPSQVDDVELENFVKSGAVDQFAAAMDACAEAATTAAEKAACVDGPAAEAMAKSMGKSSVSKAEVQEFKAKAGKKNVMNKMEACTSTATDLSLIHI